jgi:hypothetical protein
MNTSHDTARDFRADVLLQLDALSSARSDSARLDAASALARLGVWTRGDTNPRGTIWTPAQNDLPDPDRLGVLTAALDDRNPAVRSQIAAALGHWADGTVVERLARRLAASQDPGEGRYYVAALRSIGGPATVQALLDTARGQPALGTAALVAIEDLLLGDRVDDTNAPAFVRQPPAESHQEFQRRLTDLTRALDKIVRESTIDSVRAKAAELVTLLATTEPQSIPQLGDRQLDELADQIDGLPDTPVGEHLSDDEKNACAREDFEGVDVARIADHLGTCKECEAEVTALERALQPWQGARGAARIAAIVDDAAEERTAAAAAPVVVADFARRRKNFAATLNKVRPAAGLVKAALVRIDETSVDKQVSVHTRADKAANLIIEISSFSLELEGTHVEIRPFGRRLTLKRAAPDQVYGAVIITSAERRRQPSHASVELHMIDESPVE